MTYLWCITVGEEVSIYLLEFFHGQVPRRTVFQKSFVPLLNLRVWKINSAETVLKAWHTNVVLYQFFANANSENVDSLPSLPNCDSIPDNAKKKKKKIQYNMPTLPETWIFLTDQTIQPSTDHAKNIHIRESKWGGKKYKQQKKEEAKAEATLDVKTQLGHYYTVWRGCSRWLAITWSVIFPSGVLAFCLPRARSLRFRGHGCTCGEGGLAMVLVPVSAFLAGVSSPFTVVPTGSASLGMRLWQVAGHFTPVVFRPVGHCHFGCWFMCVYRLWPVYGSVRAVNPGLWCGFCRELVSLCAALATTDSLVTLRQEQTPKWKKNPRKERLRHFYS